MNISSLSADPKTWAAVTAVGIPNGSNALVENPWRDIASFFVPRSITEALSLSEFFFLNNGAYREASMRVVNYFITKLKFSGGDDDDNRKDFARMMEKDVNAEGVLREAGTNFLCYSNTLCSIHFPFTRTIVCPCKRVTNLSKVVNFGYEAEKGLIKAHCPKCGGATMQAIKDHALKDAKRIKVINWDPKRMTIMMNPMTGDCVYWYDIPEYIRSEVRRGNQFFIRTLPEPILKAIRQNSMFRFREGAIFHMKDSTIAGLDLRGWGVPAVLSSFRNFFRLQILQRQDEVIMLDYITPVRMVSPKQAGYTDGNSIMNINLERWMQNSAGMIRRHRQDGTSWNFVPFPVEYQAIGGEGLAISPKEHIQLEEDRLLNSRGIAPQFYRGDLTMQAAPVAMRLFERTWTPLVSGYDRLARWISDETAAYMNSGEFDVEMEKVTVVDDIENKMWRLQAAASEILSKETAFGPMGVEANEEYRRILEQQKSEARMTREAERELEVESMTLEQQPEGEGGGGGGASPMDVVSQADQLARKLLAMPEGDRRRELQAIRQQSQTLYANVSKRMEELRTQARSVGQDQAMQQVLEQAPPPPPEQTAGGGPAVQ